jgi:choloylglycine hydrolase
MFQILDNFNVPLSQDDAKKNPEMRSDTQWTVVYDTKNLVTYYHTQNNRRVREVDLNKIDFTNSNIIKQPLDKIKKQDIQDVTPK